jgi:hypothetical protein
MERKGWAYNLKKTPQHLVNNWAKKFGDGSHPISWEEDDTSDNTHTPLSTNILKSIDEITKSDIKVIY